MYAKLIESENAGRNSEVQQDHCIWYGFSPIGGACVYGFWPFL